MTPLPLAGLTVVELGTSVAAPFAGQVLGDLGARVVKIENPEGGDDARHWGPPFWQGASATFQSLNRNKLSAVVNFKDEAEREALREFILAEADIVLQNFRPGLVQRYGLDDSLLERKPGLIYCNLGAFGSEGPLRNRPGYDPMMQAFAGLMNITGEDNQPPVRIGPSIVDIGSGLWCVIGILSALHVRQATGRGGRIDTSLFETAMAWMTVPAALTLAGMEPGRTGSEAAMLAPYKAYRTSDERYIIIAAGNDALFRKLCTEFRKPEWITDPRFATNAVRLENRTLLNGLVEEVTRTDTAGSWIGRLEAAGVPCSPLQSISQVMEHPQAKALGMMQSVPEGDMELMSIPLRFDGRRPPITRRPPALGADTDVITQWRKSS